MFRRIGDHKHTAAVSKCGLVTAVYDDGWENILSFRMQHATEAEGIAYLLESGWEEYDPNAELKAQGFVWNGANYVKPEVA